MPRQLWLLRHGDAEPAGRRPDAERELTDKGRRQSVAAGRALVRLGARFDAVYASPRTRARDTAWIAAAELGVSPHVRQPLHGGFTREDAEELLAGSGPDARVLLVGHEPDFSQLVHDLTGGRIDLKKGGLAVIRLPAELVALLRPRELELLAGIG
jgi:phosphohistidine phosphatase